MITIDLDALNPLEKQIHVSFQDVCAAAKQKGGRVIIIAEEYNTELFNQCDKIFWLSPDPQPMHLKPYEKSRTLFFIFFEELI